MKTFTKQEVRDLLNKVIRDEVSFTRMVEIMNERVSERVSETNEPPYKDGDFVVTDDGSILIFREEVGDSIYDHAFLAGDLMLLTNPVAPSFHGIKRYATEVEKQELVDALAKEGKRWNEEKLCVEDIPKRKFKSGDKVRIKEGISSKTHDDIDRSFVEKMDDLIGKTMTVDRYTDRDYYVACEGTEYAFLEEWLEPYIEQLKKGDLAIFWDGVKKIAVIRIYGQSNESEEYLRHKDIQGFDWKNAIKFESKEQYERLIRGEI